MPENETAQQQQAPVVDEDGVVIGASVPKIWVEPEEVPILFANEFVIQFDAGAAILVIGQISPPVVLGDDHSKQHQIEHIDFVPIKVLARYALSRERLIELRDLFDKTPELYDRAAEQLARIKKTGAEQ